MMPSEDNTPMLHEVVEIRADEEVVEIRANEENTIKLYEAAVRGSIATLNLLVEKDPLILNKISLTSFNETPLHISALLGHLDFTKSLLNQKPKLTIELDSLKRSPLHLASAEDHIEIVKALLHVNNDVCLVPDQDGRIPLHLTVMRGRIEVIQELISAQPESIHVHLDGETALHLCVRYNHLEALRLLITLVDNDEFLNSRNQEGNTVLHSAVMLKQLETIKFLYSLPGVRANANALSGIGFTTLDVLEHSPRDFKSLEIRDILIEAGVRRAKELNTLIPSSPPAVVPSSLVEINTQTPSSLPTVVVNNEAQPTKPMFSKWMNYLKYQGNWVEETHGTVMLVATVIASVTFQAAINPPGGVWQGDTTTDSPNCTTQGITKCEAGTAVLAYAWPTQYLVFVTLDVISFVASLSVILLVIGGFPAKNKVCMWLMTQVMVISVTAMALTFLEGMDMVTPAHLLYEVNGMHKKAFFILLGLLAIFNVIDTIRFIYWLVGRRVSS